MIVTITDITSYRAEVPDSWSDEQIQEAFSDGTIEPTPFFDNTEIDRPDPGPKVNHRPLPLA